MIHRTIGIIIALIVLIVGVYVIISYYGGNGKERVLIKNFAECVAAGNPIMKSYPVQCATPDGKVFREDIGTEIELEDLIRVAAPRPNAIIKSPLEVTGMARGNWYFEASFPIRLLDAQGRELGVAVAQAQSEWMTTEFVPFRATLQFSSPTTPTGTLVFQKDNPSGLPEHDREHRIPVRFETLTTTPPPSGSGTNTTSPAVKACKPTGCSGQICSDTDVVSTCEYKNEYACYSQVGKCERQANGACGWTETPALSACIANARNSR